MHEELEELVLEHSLLHLCEHLPERLGVLSHDWVWVEHSIWAEADGDLEKSAAAWITEYVVEVLFRIKKQLDDLVAPIPEHEQEQAIVLSMPEPLLPILFLDGLHPDPLFMEHDQVVLELALNHFFDSWLLDLIFKSLIVFNNVFFELDHELFHSD